MSIIIHWRIYGFAQRALSFVLVVFKKEFFYFRFYSFTQFTIQLNDPEYGMYCIFVEKSRTDIYYVC